ncbi:MAG: tetratricopeptide repeat protein [Terriglobia bacterium]
MPPPFPTAVLEQRLAEARETIGKALQIYEFVLGPRHGTVAFARTTQALIEAASGRYVEAEQLADQALALARDAFGEGARQTGFPAIYAARIKAERGELAAASDAFDRAIAVFARTEPPTSLSARSARVELAHILIAMGQTDRAATVLDEADAGFQLAQDTTSVHAARATIVRAELAYAGGDRQAGAARLDQALRQIDTPDQQRNDVLPQFAAVAARFQREHHQARAALSRLDAAGLLPSSRDKLRVDIAEKARLEAAIGRLYLTEGDIEHARAWLSAAVALRSIIDTPDSPWLAEAKIALSEASNRPERRKARIVAEP